MSIKPSKITLDFQYGLGQDPYGGQLKLQSVQAVFEGVTDTGTLIRLPLSGPCTEALLEQAARDMLYNCGTVGITAHTALSEANALLFEVPKTDLEASDDIPV